MKVVKTVTYRLLPMWSDVGMFYFTFEARQTIGT